MGTAQRPSSFRSYETNYSYLGSDRKRGQHRAFACMCAATCQSLIFARELILWWTNRKLIFSWFLLPVAIWTRKRRFFGIIVAIIYRVHHKRLFFQEEIRVSVIDFCLVKKFYSGKRVECAFLRFLPSTVILMTERYFFLNDIHFDYYYYLTLSNGNFFEGKSKFVDFHLEEKWCANKRVSESCSFSTIAASNYKRM